MAEKPPKLKNITVQVATHALLSDIQNAIYQKTGDKPTYDAIIYVALQAYWKDKK